MKKQMENEQSFYLITKVLNLLLDKTLKDKLQGEEFRKIILIMRCSLKKHVDIL